ncbi:class I SAM-dependent RNA methyltransferase [Gordonia sp. (in: high G+C Gram-positive bacteria)]|uniref:class I SAM-dependent RNA methyltransferase n=1 Tax=Gordonia sp. (in: high G+C Gram-positive bacteria) TaxID=84139 RepID=UPI0035289806
MTVGEELELAVTGYANGGAGIAHDPEGRVIFVTGALPDERVRVRIDDAKPAYAKAHVTRVLEASPQRVAPLCPAAAAGAGCCDLDYARPDYAATLRAGALADVLARIGHLRGDDVPPPPAVTELSGGVAGWRVRTRLAVGRDGVPGLRSRGSSQLVTEPCAAPDPGMLRGLGDLDAAPGTELAVAVGSDGRRHVAELAPAPGGRGPAGSRRAAQRARHAAAAPRRTRMLDGDELVTQRVGGHTWRVPVSGFWQAHRAAPETYGATVRDFAARIHGAGPLRVWDLYGGAGVLGAALLDGESMDGVPPVARIDLVETAPEALAAAHEALADAPVRLHRGDTARVVRGLDAPDLVIADPPRKGAGAGVIAAVADAGPRAVVHIGCDAAAFARDLRDYVRHGFRVIDWRAFDAFPLSHHTEAIALLASP